VWPKLGSCRFTSYWSRVQSKNRASRPDEGLSCKWPPGRMTTQSYIEENLGIEEDGESTRGTAHNCKSVGGIKGTILTSRRPASESMAVFGSRCG